MTKATIKEVTVETVTVEFEDGSVAVVPLNKDWDSKQLNQEIFAYYNPRLSYEKVETVPLKAGDVIEEIVPENAKTDEKFDYKIARKAHYPSSGEQWDAAYWSRQGDDSFQKLIDDKVKLVKDTIPKSGSYSIEEIEKLLD
tara:strand:+ start:419 stop:841 length:423 start_codon:yes stop_codon:yes gene_type:complete